MKRRFVFQPRSLSRPVSDPWAVPSSAAASTVALGWSAAPANRVRSAACSGAPALALSAARLICEDLEGRTLLSVSTDARGFTVVTPSTDSRIIYVSSSGSDANTGLDTAHPVQTIAKARTLVRDKAPDEILLRRGDVFDNQGIATWAFSGRSASEPFVIGAYTDPLAPSSERPKINSGLANGIGFSTATPQSNIYVMGIAFEANLRNYREPPAGFTSDVRADTSGGTYGLRVLGNVDNLLVEDCSFQYYRTNITVESSTTTGGVFRPTSNIRIRRNQILDAYSPNVDASGQIALVTSEGIYAEQVNGLTIDGNVLDHNGWVDSNALGGSASIYNHNLYINSGNTNVVVSNNVIANAGAHGLQMRAGGIVTNNVFLRNPIGMSFGYVNGTATPGGVSGEISNNVFLEDRDIAGAKRGFSLEMANLKPASQGGGTVVRNNIFAADTQNSFATIRLSLPDRPDNASQQVGINDLTLDGNLVYSWYRGISIENGYVVGGGVNLNGINNLTVRNNDFQRQFAGSIIEHLPAFNANAETWVNNRYDAIVSDSTSPWFKVGGSSVNTSTWKSLYEPTAAIATGVFPDPTRGVGKYNGTLGGGTTTDDFVAQVRRQSSAFWRTAYTTDPVLDYIRAGFTGGKIDLAAPTASATAPGISIAGAPTQTLTVVYSDDNKLNTSSIGTGDVLVTGPNGYSAVGTLVSSNGPSDGSRRTATYSIAAPNGQTWTAAANGLYSIVLQPGEVLDVTGKSGGSDFIGTFSVAIDPATPMASATAPGISVDTAPATVTVTYTGTSTPSLPVSVAPINAGFETPNVGSDNWGAWAVAPAGSGWTWTNSAGITGNNSGYTGSVAASPQGAQAAFIQGGSSMSQTIANWQAGTYTVSFQAAQRSWFNPASEDFQVLLDGQVIGTFNPQSDGAYHLLSTSPVTVAAGSHTLAFVGINSAGSDNTAFIDDIQIIGNTAGGQQLVSAASLDAADIRLTGPNGYVGTPTQATADQNADGVQRVVTYVIPAPAAGWSSVGNGAYAINTVAGQVTMTSSAAVPAGKVGTLNVAVNAPTALVAAGNVTVGSTAAQTFTVTYTADAGIQAGTIDSGDLGVTGPGGFNSAVTLVGTNGGAGTSASPLVATYTVNAPAAGWSSAGNGTYWIVAQQNQVIDGNGNALPAGAIGSFRVAIDTTAPVTWNLENDVINSPPLNGTSSTKTVGVSYYDISGINGATLDNNDIHVIGPNGYDQTLTIPTPASSNISNGATAAFVNYVLQPPVGGWKSSYNGVYSVVLMPFQVYDNVGNTTTAPRTISTFNVALETNPPFPSLPAVSPNPRNFAVSSVSVTFANNTSSGTVNEAVTGFDLSDLTLTRNGVAVPLSGATLSTSDNITWTIGNLSGLTGTAGSYLLSVNSSGTGIVDLAGNAMISGTSAAWTVDLTAPTASATAPTITLPSSAAQTITVTYSDSVGLNLATLNSSDITVSGPNGYFAAGTFVTSTGSSTSRTATYTVPAPAGGWKSGFNGAYSINLVAGQVADSAGNFAPAGTIGSFSVGLETTPPTVTIGPVSQPSAGTPVSSVPINFSEAVTGFDLADLSLTRDGVAVSLAGATITSNNGAIYTVGNLGAATQTPGNYTLTLNAAGSGIADLAGNALSTGASAGFTITPPPASFADNSFESPNLGFGGFAYGVGGTPWTFAGGSGIASNGSAFTGDNVPAPDGTQVAFLQGTGVASQTISGIDAGSYVINLQAAQRGSFQDTFQSIDVRVDGTSVGTFQPASDRAYHSFTTFPISLAAGSHVVSFVGLNPNGGDNTALIDAVSLALSPTPALAAQIGPVAAPSSTINSIPINFNRVVSGFDLSDLTLTRDGQPVALDGAMLSSADGQSFTLSNLPAETSSIEGNYVLTLNAANSGIVDTQGVPLFSNAFATWTNSTVAAPAISGISPNPVSGSSFVQDLTINGTDFPADAAVTLRNLSTGAINPNPTIISRSANQLVVRATFGTTASNWTAEVTGATGSSGQVAFGVSAQKPISISVAKSSAGKSATLSVLNAVGSGLTFTWSATLAPTDAPTVLFTDSGTSSAANTLAIFGKAGSYTLNVQITDGASVVNVPTTVNIAQQQTSMTVTPSSATVSNAKTLQLKAQTLDQFGNPMSSQPTFTWSKTSGIGTISSSGLYTAPSSGSGTATIKAASGSLSATASITVGAAWKLWVDFVPSSASVVSGYQRDGGSVYGSRGNGFTYGWNVSHTDAAVDRNNTSNQIVDTNVGVKTGGKWEAFVANGTYSVLVGVGDSRIATTNTVRVEGVTAMNAVKLSANSYSTKTVTVTVTDGRLTIDAGSSANLTTRLTYLKITRV